MFGAKQVQTLDVSKVMDQILENHDAKVTVDRLNEFLNRELENALAARNDDEEIKSHNSYFKQKMKYIYDDYEDSEEGVGGDPEARLGGNVPQLEIGSEQKPVAILISLGGMPNPLTSEVLRQFKFRHHLAPSVRDSPF